MKTQGNADANRYHSAVEEFLSSALYPMLSNGRKEEKLHDGRKRVDIVYDNVDRSRFFFWLAQHGYRCPFIFVECKNYSRNVENPEFDQLSGRFSDQRGKIGLLIYRQMDEKQKVITSCRDAARDGRGWMIPIDDYDLESIANLLDDNDLQGVDAFLRNIFSKLVM
ncbi:MAG: hypothetical protein EOP04_22600 [Proteobacteria bacterium]|nr:MAG: hypothetical protein EOP04_22600 [Pseudomonadota bacterium]